MHLLAKFIAYSVKEFRVVARDPANLAILFVMPVGFVIIMSLALQDFYIQQAGAPDNSRRAQFSVVLLDGDGGAIATAIYQQLSRLGFVEVRRLPTAEFPRDAAQLREQVRSGKERFALLVPAGVSDRMAAVLAHADPAQLLDVPAERKIVLDLLIDPAVRADQRLLVSNAMMRVLQSVEIREAIARVLHGRPAEPVGGRGPIAMPASDGLLSLNASVPSGAFDGKGSGAVSAAPTSSQQNVSAYSLLAIFMLVVPLSQTFIKERAQGSLTRLRSIGVPGLVIVGGKILPYFVINLVQMALCLCVGRFLLPLMGGEALQFGVKSLPSIAVLTAAASLAAIGFALMVSMFARTAEQATAFGATAILLLAALGGIMVPKTVMPPWLQHYAAASPLGWAQEGFLDLFVRGAGMADIQRRAAALLAFAGVCVLLALWRFRSVGRS
jgi:ABC-2 type transport system permease protein